MNALSAPHSHFICTAEQCRQMDAKTIDEFGIDGFTLMEVAGSSAAKHLLNMLKPGSHGLYLCGKGNNAGDALVIARYLAQHGFKATVVFLSGIDDLSPDADHNLTLFKKIAANDLRSPDIKIIKRWNNFEPATRFDFIIDGMLGTGLNSDLKGEYLNAVEWANTSGLPIYSIDIPSGLHADSGHVMGTAICASKTFSFGALKQGYYLDEGYQCTGNIMYCDLPFPNYLKSCDTFLLDETWVKEPPRAPSRHKYEAGILYVIAGSEGLTGAAIMAAKSAWAEGLGAVIIICPRGILPVFENNLPQIIKKPVGKREENFLKKEHLETVLTLVNEKPGKILFGPGIGRNSSTLEFATKFFKQCDGELLIDADALWCLAQKTDWGKPGNATWIITPHPGELSALLNTGLRDGQDRLKYVRQMSANKNITVVSKGFPAIIGTPGQECYLTGYDTRIFARAGFGDVLAGKIGAYWAGGNSATLSSALGLLDGYKKVTSLNQYDNYIPEPNDLI